MIVETFKENELVAIKFVSGEEILCKYKNEDNLHIGIEKALTLMNGPQGMAMGTFFSTSDPDKVIAIRKESILSMAPMNPKLIEQYSNIFSKIKQPAKPSIIT